MALSMHGLFRKNKYQDPKSRSKRSSKAADLLRSLKLANFPATNESTNRRNPLPWRTYRARPSVEMTILHPKGSSLKKLVLCLHFSFSKHRGLLGGPRSTPNRWHFCTVSPDARHPEHHRCLLLGQLLLSALPGSSPLALSEPTGACLAAPRAHVKLIMRGCQVFMLD